MNPNTEQGSDHDPYCGPDADYRAWWAEICRQSDPQFRPNLAREAFYAGFNAGMVATARYFAEQASAHRDAP